MKLRSEVLSRSLDFTMQYLSINSFLLHSRDADNRKQHAVNLQPMNSLRKNKGVYEMEVVTEKQI